MARQQPKLDNFFRPTEPQPEPRAEDLAQPTAQRSAPADDVDRTLPVGVGLKGSEVAALDDIAAELGIKRNAVMRYALAWFVREYRAGRATVPIERTETRRVKMP